MFTPQEVSEKVFPKASFGSGGYSMSSVDEFLDALTEDYSTLFKENVTLKAKLKVLAEKVEEYRSTEDAMRQTLLTAQKMAAKLVQEAQAEKDRMLSGAKAEAAQEIQRLESEKQAAQQKLAMAQEKLAEFIRRSDELCQAQSAFLQTLPELELVPAAPAEPAAEPAPQPDKAVEDVTVHAQVPADWADPSCWAWSAPDGTNAFASWPGEALTKDGDWYNIQVPGWINSVIINANEGAVQTTDLSVEAGKEVWVVVTDAENAQVFYEAPAQDAAATEPAAETTVPASTEAPQEAAKSSNTGVIVGVVAAVVLLGGGAAILAKKKKS